MLEVYLIAQASAMMPANCASRLVAIFSELCSETRPRDGGFDLYMITVKSLHDMERAP